MNITTETYELTKSEYFRIVASGYFRRTWIAFPLFLLILVPWVISEVGGVWLAASVLFIFVVILLLSPIIRLWLNLNNKENAGFFEKRYLEIDDEFIASYDEDGSFGKLKIDSLVRVMKASNHYLLYVSQRQFMYLPFDAFSSEEDRMSFEALLISKELISRYKTTGPYQP